MKSDYTHISVILDRSGSMESIRDDIIGGFNAFVKEQKSLPGEATLSLVQFDTQDAYEIVCQFTPVKAVPELDRKVYVPRSGTPLLDALGLGINDLEKALTEMKEDDRPSQVVMVIITDGQENSSKEFRKDQIVKMIKNRTDNDGWQFVFLSADMAAIGDAVSYGMQRDATMYFDKTARGTAQALSHLSVEVSAFRTLKKAKIGFVPPESEDTKDPKKKEQ
jgi:hypothetical protein